MSTSSKMNSINNLHLIHPEHTTTPVSNMPFDESIEFRTSDCVSSEVINKINELQESQRFGKEDFNVYKIDCLPPLPPTKEEKKDLVDEIEQQTFKAHYYVDAMDMKEAMRLKRLSFNGINLGDGKMDYIQDEHNKLMMTNAWQAITKTNTWDFVTQYIDSFMWSDDPRIDKITEKMCELGYDGHSGSSFGCTMRNMQFLAQKGEEEFKKLFEKNPEKGVTKFLDYSGGF